MDLLICMSEWLSESVIEGVRKWFWNTWSNHAHLIYLLLEGKSAAATFDCKYFEVSALMSLRVDELLAGVVNQIRLRKLKRLGPCSPVTEGRKSPLRLINKILKRQAPVSKSCDNLLVLWITMFQLRMHAYIITFWLVCVLVCMCVCVAEAESINTYTLFKADSSMFLYINESTHIWT